MSARMRVTRSAGMPPIRTRIAAACGAALLLLSACASPGPEAGTSGQDEGAAPDDSMLLAVSDPLEGLNRRVYAFNAQADRWVLLPIVDAYKFALPIVLRDRVSDFFSNIGNMITFANQILQLKFAEALSTALRFGANTTFGMLGIVDIASEMGMPRYDEDFGQTLGYWGVGDGPYLVLPILGPSNVRDTAGMATDAVAFSIVDPFYASSVQTRYPAILALDVVNSRYVQPFRYYESGSPFEYDLVRFLYTKKRQVEIGDGAFRRGAAGMDVQHP